MTRDTRTPRVAIVNLGCRVNRVEVDLIATQLIDLGCVIVDSAEADVVVINTCAVTGEAQAKTRKAVRHAADLPQSPRVIACGCAANLFAAELCGLAPGVVVEARKDQVPKRVLEAVNLNPIADDRRVSTTHLAISQTPTGRMRPGVKIQDGCDNRCSYCIVWKARGPSRSLASQDVVAAVTQACERGAHEVVLTGINLGSYRTGAGDALGEGMGLDALLAHLLESTSIDRLRLSSIEPPDVTDSLLAVMAGSSGRIAPFLHVCLQSGCDSTLSRMGRLYTTAQYADMVAKARTYLPGVAIETDVIAGFPGEDEREFARTLSFCSEMEFARMHVFRFSKRPGTPAAELRCQVPAPEIASRARQLRILGKEMRDNYVRRLDGTIDNVLVIEEGRAVGGHLVEMSIDPSLRPGTYIQVRLNLNFNLKFRFKAEVNA